MEKWICENIFTYNFILFIKEMVEQRQIISVYASWITMASIKELPLIFTQDDFL